MHILHIHIHYCPLSSRRNLTVDSFSILTAQTGSAGEPFPTDSVPLLTLESHPVVSALRYKEVGPKYGLETSNANDIRTHSLALVTQSLSLIHI